MLQTRLEVAAPEDNKPAEAEADEEPLVVSLTASCWDVPMLIGTAPVGGLGSLWLALLLVLNVVVQGLFLWVTLAPASENHH